MVNILIPGGGMVQVMRGGAWQDHMTREALTVSGVPVGGMVESVVKGWRVRAVVPVAGGSGVATVDAPAVVAAPALNWEPMEKPLTMYDGVACPDRKAIHRSDSGAYIGTVGTGYQLFRNAELLDLLDTVRKADGLAWANGGTSPVREYYGGAVIAAELALPLSVEPVVGDLSRLTMVAKNAHDGSGSFRFEGPRLYRYSCANGASRLVDSGVNVVIRHTSKMGARVAAARDAVRRSSVAAAEIAEKARGLAGRKLSDDGARSYFREVFPAPVAVAPEAAPAVVDGSALLAGILDGAAARAQLGAELAADALDTLERQRKRHAKLLDTLVDLYHMPQNEGGTLWHGFNAVTDYVDHSRTTRGGDENREYAGMWGTGAELKSEAWRLAVAAL